MIKEETMEFDRVLALGVFDLFHVGHLRYLQYVRRQGRHLIVAVGPDALCARTKGKRPVIPEDQRMELIRGLGWVDEVRPQPSSMEQTLVAAQWIGEWGVQHVVAGGDWEGSDRFARLIAALAERGVTVAFAPHTEGVSTTRIVGAIRQMAGPPP